MSTSPKHSPGPWDYQLVRNGDDPQYPELRIYDADGDAIIQQSQSGYDTFTAITIEDARIIAAAPKMLQALKALNLLAMEWEQARYGKTHKEMQGYLYQPEIYDAQSAIAKAEGRAEA